jgi:hypothetical protein
MKDVLQFFPYWKIDFRHQDSKTLRITKVNFLIIIALYDIIYF